MTEIQNPGSPAHDVLAANAVRNEMAGRIGSALDGTSLTEDDEVIDTLADTVVRAHTVTWERDINSAGVPVRRAVLRETQWQVDPEPPVHRVRKGDVVHVAGQEFGEHDDWIVTAAVPVAALDPDNSIVFVRRPEWMNGEYVTTAGRMVRIVSRPHGGTGRP